MLKFGLYKWLLVIVALVLVAVSYILNKNLQDEFVLTSSEIQESLSDEIQPIDPAVKIDGPKSETMISSFAKKNDSFKIPVSPEDAVEIAIQEIRTDFDDISQTPDVMRTNDIYLVQFWRRRNPYVNRSSYSSKCSINAYTGEVISTIYYHGGTALYQFKRVKGDPLAKEEREKYAKSVMSALSELENRGRKLGRLPDGDKPTTDMIAPAIAEAVGRKIITGKRYDLSRPPQVALVGNIYIVIFWKLADQVTFENDLLYAYRVGVNAITGDFMALETAF